MLLLIIRRDRARCKQGHVVTENTAHMDSPSTVVIVHVRSTTKKMCLGQVGIIVLGHCDNTRTARTSELCADSD